MALFSKLKKLIYIITTDTSGVKKGTKESEKAFRDLNNKSRKNISDIQVNFKKLGIAIGVIGTAIGAVLAKIGKDSIKAAGVQELADKKLMASINNLKEAREGAFERLKTHAAELQKVTAIGDEQIINNQALLATFQLNEEAIKELMPRILDMGAGNAELGQTTADLKAITLAIGKSFTMGIGALSRYGVAMTDTEQKAFQLASQQDKVRILNEILDNNFKGQAAAVRESYIGQMEALKNAFGDLEEEIGQALMPTIKNFIPKLQDAIKEFRNWKDEVNSFDDELDESKKNFNKYVEDINTILRKQLLTQQINELESALNKIEWAETLNPLTSVAKALHYYFDVAETGDTQKLRDHISDLKGQLIALMNEALVPLKDKIKETTNETLSGLNQERFDLNLTTDLWKKYWEAQISFPTKLKRIGTETPEQPPEYLLSEGENDGTIFQKNIDMLPLFVQKNQEAADGVGFIWQKTFQGFEDNFYSSFKRVLEKYGTAMDTMKTIGKDFGDAFVSAVNGVGAAFGEWLIVGGDIKDMLKNILKQFLVSIATALTQAAIWQAVLLAMNFLVPGSGTAFATLIAGMGNATGGKGGGFDMKSIMEGFDLGDLLGDAIGGLFKFKKGGIIGDMFNSIKRLPKAASGLITTGIGDRDNIPALLKPNEVVMPFEWIGDFFKKSAENLFAGFAMPQMPQMATAGASNNAPVINLSVNVDGSLIDNEVKLDNFVRKLFRKLEEHAYPNGIRNKS